MVQANWLSDVLCQTFNFHNIQKFSLFKGLKQLLSIAFGSENVTST